MINKKINECLEGKHGSYIIPFLWLHGENHERLYEEISAIYNSGIREFCAESRPHPNFMQEQWWSDFEFILQTAQSLGMSVWLLDDSRCPTGYANGYLKNPERAQLRKLLIRELNIDVPGPVKKAKVLVDLWLNKEKGEEVYNIVAYRHTENEEIDALSAIDLTNAYSDDCVYFDVPEGVWRVCITIRTRGDYLFEGRKAFYIDNINPESCKAMIEAVYKPHYEHFSKYFGTTFKGFFTDEPGFFNAEHGYYDTLGISRNVYPWRDDLPELIAESSGISCDKVKLLLPSIWEDMGENTALLRTHYMEVITKLYGENFCEQLGDWCRKHNVEYIGHVLEDDNAHMRTGYGCGHFFRALDGQDMAGMDSVLHQHIPGINDCKHSSSTSNAFANPAFFDYALPKMASSHGHIQPLKKGRAMCECFGAYGWAEGLTFMKQVTDLLLVCGINYFVPHAFSPKTDDMDSPPHFYKGGKNVQYPLFKNLMNYMGRMSHILQGGIHRASVAVFYNAEGEWAGGKNQLFQEVCKVLTRGNIDFDIIPYDALLEATVINGKLCVNKEAYEALIVSYSEVLPISRIECFAKLKKAGLPILFSDDLPRKSSENVEITQLIKGFEAVRINNIAQILRERGFYDITVSGKNAEHLRFYHVVNGQENTYMFYNENIYDVLDLNIKLRHDGKCLVYDAWSNSIYQTEASEGMLHLVIEQGNAIIISFNNEIPEGTRRLTFEKERKSLDLKYDIYIKPNGNSNYELYAANSGLLDISAPEHLPRFSGSVLYKAVFTPDEGFNVLDLGQVGETAEVWINGQPCGVRVNAPYKFDMTGAIHGQENKLKVEVISNPAHENRTHELTGYLLIPPTGIIGDVAECKYE